MLTQRSRLIGLALAALLLSAGSATAQQDRDRDERERERERGRDGLFARVLHLMPPHTAQQLNLSEEQKQQIEKLEQEFKSRRQAVLMGTALKVSGIIQSVEEEGQNAEPAPVLAISHEVTGGLLQMRRIRAKLEKQMMAVLSAEQKEQYISLREGRRDDDDDDGRERRRRRGELREGGPFSLFSPNVQQRLNLTAEQKQKLSQMRQQWEQQLKGVLTEEQQEQFERMRGGRRSETDAERPTRRRPIQRRETNDDQ